MSDWPLCDYFVVLTDRGFSLLHWEDGLWVFVAGDDVFGSASRLGRQHLVLRGGVTLGEMTVEVLLSDLDLLRARRAYQSRCEPRDVPLSHAPGALPAPG